MKKYIFICLFGMQLSLLCSFSPPEPQIIAPRGSLAKENVYNAWRSMLQTLTLPGNYRALGYAVKLAHSEGLTLEQLKTIAKETKCTPLEFAIKATKSIMKIDRRLDLTEGECLQLALFIEAELKAVIEEKSNYVSMKQTRLPCSIEFDPKSNITFIHLKDHIGSRPIGKGCKKLVTKSIQYDREHPKLVAHCSTTYRIRHEVQALEALEGLPGLMEFHAITRRKLKSGEKNYSIMCKLYRHGTLEKFLKKKKHKLTLSEKLYIANDILKGIESMHQMQYVHRDINVRNFLMDRKPHEKGEGERDFAVAADFGRARAIEDLSGKPAQGNSHFLAPEAYSFKEMNGSDYFYSDIYATGCVLYLLNHGKKAPWAKSEVVKNHRFEPEQSADLLRKALRAYRDMRFSQLDAQVRYRVEMPVEERFERLILKMVDPQPHGRGSLSELRQTLESILAQAVQERVM